MGKLAVRHRRPAAVLPGTRGGPGPWRSGRPAPRPSGTNVAARAALAGIAAAAALLAVAGCGTSQYLYVGNTADHVFFKVPAAWHKLSAGEIATAQRSVLGPQSPAGQAGGPLIWSAAFDAAPNPSALHIFSVTGTPVVYASVQQMNTVQRDRMSFDSMRDLLAPVTAQARKQAAAAGARLSQFQSIGYQVLTRSGGVRGIGEQFQYTLGGTPEDFLQVVMTNSDTTKLYFFLIQCDQTCFTTYRNQIAAVVGSFTVRGS